MNIARLILVGFGMLIGAGPVWGWGRTGHRVINTLAQNEAIALERLMTIGRQSARERMAHLLVELVARAREAGLKVTDRGFTLPLTQTHIADATGLSPVSANVTNSLSVVPGYAASAYGTRKELAELLGESGRRGSV